MKFPEYELTSNGITVWLELQYNLKDIINDREYTMVLIECNINVHSEQLRVASIQGILKGNKERNYSIVPDHELLVKLNPQMYKLCADELESLVPAICEYEDSQPRDVYKDELTTDV